jgi:hypothetical protein
MNKQDRLQLKAKIMADRANGDTIEEIAERYNVGVGTVHRFASDIPTLEARTARATSPTVIERRENEILDLGALVGRLLVAKIETAIAISEHAKNPEWLMNQTANDLAIYMGVNEDKVIRLLESVNRQINEVPQNPRD